GRRSQFEGVAEVRAAGSFTYGPGAPPSAGAPLDPTSHDRAARVFDFFEELELTPDLLRQVSQHQVGLLASLFDALDADPRVITRDRAVTLSELGGFLALQSPRAEELCRRLRDRSVAADFRADTLRLGPAPYVSDLQLRTAIDALG